MRNGGKISLIALMGALAFTPVWAETASHWMRSSAAAARHVDPAKAATVENATIRQTLRLTQGGKALRVRVSNEHGNVPLKIGAASVRIDGQFYPLTFSGQSGISAPAGAPVLSDPVAADIGFLEAVEVNLYFPEKAVLSTMHGDNRNPALTSGAGDFTQTPDLPVAQSVRHRPFVTAIEVEAAAPLKTIVAFGDSITDADCTIGPDQCRWSEVLAERLQAAGKPYAVANAGISGNRLLSDSYGVSALARFERDVLSVPNVSHVIVLIGINDIGGSSVEHPVTAADMIAGYKQLIARTHARGLKIYGAEILPFLGAGYASDDKEKVRLEVNEWIRNSGAFDGLIGFAAAVADPADPARLAGPLQTGDNLHPNVAGQRAMGAAIDLNLF
ncbi:SGNH/GDSL hydrolase family protein [Asticcacaulis tiandongensis]|uniref:SGNH/GDSL hydrolase family protein n=1 Tax=Asticcacaulis tiandongensis TaxID=2565365 RepID=UPI00112AE510|nr:SGNH/GDSL hydrolase family protein [Asticcacaulis tiandongensis]